MLLEGACHCQAVKFSVTSHHPYPFNLCYCSVCRKTAGGGGYVINLSGKSKTLDVKGGENVSIYRAVINGEKSTGERHFCKHCATALWVYDPDWPELVHPFASAIDTDLPIPPERTHMMLGSRADWVEVNAQPKDKCFDEYPDESLAEWHQRLGLER
ncbi:GFA family protein [Vreelandella nanhaiensis]|uniref:GFA family protein n=1 Tax=Vreelandella nanhaiensis TaxID=1258546 RepID=A0A433KXH5_9GAMM|nr:GFA family protein [Halomonas nanhaiensis]RUR34210.1 GFA family protein [Halomonas nanhaiensis]